MDKVKEQKLLMWKQQEKELREQLKVAMVAKGKAAAEGDLSENAAYKDAVETAEVISVRFLNVQKIIHDLEKKA